MKRLILSMFLLFTVLILPAAPRDTAPQPDYRKTLSELQATLDKGIESPDLHYNIGVCQAKLNLESEAILSFLRCLNLNSAHKQARANLEYLISLSPDSQLYPQHQFISQQLLDLYEWFSINRSSMALLIMLLLSVACLHWLLHYHQDRERGLPTLLLIISAVLLLGTCALVITKTYRMNYNRKAVMISSAVSLQEELKPGSRSIRTIHRGLIVQVMEQTQGRSRVVLPNGNGGWVNSSDLERVIR